MIGPMKSNWTPSLGPFTAGKFFRKWYVRFNVLSGYYARETCFALLLIASAIFGHQNCCVVAVILLIALSKLCKRLNIVARNFFGTIIVSSRKTWSNLLDNFLFYI